MAFEKLFEKNYIGAMELRNRIVLPPMVRNWATEEGEVTERLVNHYAELAKGGAAMLINEATFVLANGKGFIHETGIHDDKMIPGLKQLVGAAHEHGAKIGPQLYHAGRQTSSKITGSQPVAPSPIPCPVMQEMPKELTVEQIAGIEDAFAEGARRAKEAGFDFVEVHGAHGYIITQFLSPFSNKRDDEYGGDLDGRMKFLTNIINKIRAKVGDDYPIVVRLSGDEGVEGGLRLEDTREIAKRLEALGVDALHISGGNYGSYAQGLMIPPMAVPEGPFIHLSGGVKEVVKIPVIAVSKINTPELAEEVIVSGQADLVALGRELIADPEWPNKVANNEIDDINRCISCNQGCIDRLFQQLDTQCVVNPRYGREKEFAIVPAKEPKKVMVIGGGPAGMEAAIVAKRRGHDVSLYEKEAMLGGELNLAEKPPFREGITWLKEYLIGQVHKLGIEENLNTEVTPELIGEVSPDAIIVATGSSCAMPPIPGVENELVVSPRDLLAGKAEVGKKVIVAGGGSVGVETAAYLADKGHKVTVVEMKDEIATDMGISDRFLLLERFAKYPVAVMTKTKIIKITDKGMVVDENGEEKSMDADSVVLCVGAKPNNEIVEMISGLAPVITVAGDANEPRRLLEAVYEGYSAALNI